MYTFRMEVSAPPDRVFPLLCPKREHEWLAGWTASVLRSASGFAEPGCVFQSGPGTSEQRCTWIVVEHVAPRRVAFALVQPGQFAEVLTIDLVGRDAHTALTWSRQTTPLSAAGEQTVALRLRDADARHAYVARALSHFLRTGTCLEAGG